MAAFKSCEKSFTKGCMQYGLGTKYYFPCCPKEIGVLQLDNYLQNLKVGSIFAHQYDAPNLIAIKFLKIKNNSAILVMCEREGAWCERLGFFPWVLCEITYENGFFIHSKLEECFEKDEAEQTFFVKQGSNETMEV